MDWPETPVEQIPPSKFFPEFCPWPECRSHRPDPGHRPRFHRHGCHTKRSAPRSVPRFRCLDCLRTCSQQTFSTTYYLKRPELLCEVAAGLNAGSAHRQIGRSEGCAPSTVTRLAARLGRHALLFHVTSLKEAIPVEEATAYDDFQSFAHSQDLPFGAGTAVGLESWFVYSLQFTPHRRGGGPRRRPRKKTARKIGGESTPAPGGYARAFKRTVDILLEGRSEDDPLHLNTDDHPGYRAGLKDHPQRNRVRHHIFPNPKPRFKDGKRTALAAERDEAMFAVDLLHMLIRHSLAHHRRETIAFGQRHNALLERIFLMVVWRNFIKARTERKPDNTTPAMFIGLTDEPWSWSRVLARRLFPSRIDLPEEWRRIYRREILTVEIGRNRLHELKHAA